MLNIILLFYSPFFNLNSQILNVSLSHVHSFLSLSPLLSSYSMSAAGRIGTSDLVDRTYRFVKKVREDEEAAAPKVYVPRSIDSDLIDEEDSVYN